MTVWSCAIAGGDYERAGVATRGLKEVLRSAGVDASSLRRVMIASYEAEMNVVIHARRGRLEADIGSREIRVIVADEGPGIADLALAMTEGYSTAPEAARRLGFGAGLGLPNIKKHSDVFTLESKAGDGTCVRFAVRYEPIALERSAVIALRIHAERCRQCGRCVRACPTGALRLREGGPRVLAHACIECTECALACAARVFSIDAASAPSTGGVALLFAAESLVRLPLGMVGADTEAALAAYGFALGGGLEEWARALRVACARRAIDTGDWVLSPVCAAVIALVASRHPGLLPFVAPHLGPLEAAATTLGTATAVVVTCPAQRTALAAGGMAPDRIFGPAEIERLLAPIVARAGRTAAQVVPTAEPAVAGESIRDTCEGVPVVCISGTRAVMRTLDLLDERGLRGPAVLELYACAGGCDGSGFLSGAIAGLAEHVATSRWRPSAGAVVVERRAPLTPRYGQVLDPDMSRAIEKLAAIEELSRSLSGRDCVACGAPTCRAFAEDVVLGRTTRDACPEAPAGGIG